MKPTCTGRRTCAGTMSTAAYRWKSDMTTSSVVVTTPSQPRWRLVAPSSSSMYASALAESRIVDWNDGGSLRELMT